MNQATFGNLPLRDEAMKKAWELNLFARPEGEDGLTVCGPSPKIALLRETLSGWPTTTTTTTTESAPPPDEEEKNS